MRTFWGRVTVPSTAEILSIRKAGEAIEIKVKDGKVNAEEFKQAVEIAITDGTVCIKTRMVALRIRGFGRRYTTTGYSLRTLWGDQTRDAWLPALHVGGWLWRDQGWDMQITVLLGHGNCTKRFGQNWPPVLPSRRYGDALRYYRCLEDTQRGTAVGRTRPSPVLIAELMAIRQRTAA